jgi:hypothetical protein
MSESRQAAVDYLMYSLDAYTDECQNSYLMPDDEADACRRRDRDALKALGVTDEEILHAES